MVTIDTIDTSVIPDTLVTIVTLVTQIGEER